MTNRQAMQEDRDREVAQPRCVYFVCGTGPVDKVWERRIEELGVIGIVDCQSGDFGVNTAYGGLDLLVEPRASQDQI